MSCGWIQYQISSASIEVVLWSNRGVLCGWEIVLDIFNIGYRYIQEALQAGEGMAFQPYLIFGKIKLNTNEVISSVSDSSDRSNNNLSVKDARFMHESNMLFPLLMV